MYSFVAKIDAGINQVYSTPQYFKGMVSIIMKSDHGDDNFTPGVFLLKIPESFNRFP